MQTPADPFVYFLVFCRDADSKTNHLHGSNPCLHLGDLWGTLVTWRSSKESRPTRSKEQFHYGVGYFEEVWVLVLHLFDFGADGLLQWAWTRGGEGSWLSVLARSMYRSKWSIDLLRDWKVFIWRWDSKRREKARDHRTLLMRELASRMLEVRRSALEMWRCSKRRCNLVSTLRALTARATCQLKPFATCFITMTR